MFDTRVIPIGAAGTGARAWTLQSGWQIAGIRIDNKSGSWLLLNDGTFVPPYTLSFGHSFQPTLASIDVLFANGPAGQVTTQQGDSPVVTIYSEPVGESPGVPSGQGTAFVQQFTPGLTFSIANIAPVSVGATSVLVAAITSKRLRLLTWSVQRSLVPGDTDDGGGVFLVTVGGGIGFVFDRIMFEYLDMEKTHVFPNGLDWPVGAAMSATVAPRDANIRYLITGTYQVI